MSDVVALPRSAFAACVVDREVGGGELSCDSAGVDVGVFARLDWLIWEEGGGVKDVGLLVASCASLPGRDALLGTGVAGCESASDDGTRLL